MLDLEPYLPFDVFVVLVIVALATVAAWPTRKH